MSLDLGKTFVFCIYAVLQIYILLGSGFILFYKKIFLPQNIKQMSSILFNVFIPVFATIEIARVTSVQNIKIFWVLAINCLSSMVVGLLLGLFLHWIFRIDIRIKFSFTLIISLPALGSLPLVLGKALCYVGGPLNSDPMCNNILGLQMINFLIFVVYMFILSFILMPKDSNVYYIIKEKKHYIWQTFIRKMNLKQDPAIINLITKYSRKPEEVTEKFFKQNFLRVNDNYDYFYYQNEAQYNEDMTLVKVHNNDNLYVKNVLDLKEGEKLIKSKSYREFKKVQAIPSFKNSSNNKASIKYSQIPKEQQNKLEELKEENENETLFANGNGTLGTQALINNQENINKNNENEDYFNNSNSSQSMSADFQYFPGKSENCESPESQMKKNKMNVSIPEILNKTPSIHDIDVNDKNGFMKQNYLDSENEIILKLKNFKQGNSSHEKNESLNNKRASIYINRPYRSKSIRSKSFIFSSIKKPILGNMKVNSIKSDKVNIDQNMIKKSNSFILKKEGKKIIKTNPLKIYYGNLFNLIEQNLKNNVKNEFEIEKKIVLENIEERDTQRFPIVDGVPFNPKNNQIFNTEWASYENKMIEKGVKIPLHYVPIKTDFNMIMSKVLCPPAIGGVLGILIGISNLYTILFSSNHYITNAVNILYVLERAFVPILFANVGFGLASTKGFHRNIIINKFNLIITVVVRMFVIPFIGMGFITLWKQYFGGIVASSSVFRFSMFMPFCLPGAPNLIIVTNLLNFFKEDLGLVLFLHNVTLLITQTVMMLIYFLIMENNF